jgi:uncharacterized membrane protein YraQ (UPF0718 family)
MPEEGGRRLVPGKGTLIDVVDVFSCCILNWEAFTVVLPAFIMAGAIAVFVPAPVLLKYFGATSRKPVAYAVAAVSGCVLAVCSCNIVPLFVSIYRRGAGLGPAVTFLYCGPAINIVSLAFVYQVIGWRLGLWRMLAVPVIGILAGLLMTLLFRREEAKRQEEVAATAALTVQAHSGRRVAGLLGMLFLIMLVGSMKQQEVSVLNWPVKIAVMLGLAATTGVLCRRWFDREALKDWGIETWKLVRMVVPILLVSVLVIGLLAVHVRLTDLQRLGLTSQGGDRWQSAFLASAFGSVMYFPMLSEIAFVKAFLKLNDMPAHLGLIILLTGPGLSLPGMILIGRAVGLKKTAAYVVIMIVLAALIGQVFRVYIGQYVCPCTTGRPDPFPLWAILGRLLH